MGEGGHQMGPHWPITMLFVGLVCAVNGNARKAKYDKMPYFSSEVERKWRRSGESELMDPQSWIEDAMMNVMWRGGGLGAAPVTSKPMWTEQETTADQSTLPVPTDFPSTQPEEASLEWTEFTPTATSMSSPVADPATTPVESATVIPEDTLASTAASTLDGGHSDGPSPVLLQTVLVSAAAALAVLAFACFGVYVAFCRRKRRGGSLARWSQRTTPTELPSRPPFYYDSSRSVWSMLSAVKRSPAIFTMFNSRSSHSSLSSSRTSTQRTANARF